MLVGQWRDGSLEYRAFAWTAAGGFVDLGAPAGAVSAAAWGINDAHQVVGTINHRSVGGPSGSYGTGAFLWRQGSGMMDLASLFAGSGFAPIAAHDINNRAQIVGVGNSTDSSGAPSPGSYLLTLHPDWAGGNGNWADTSGTRWNWGGTGTAAARVGDMHDVWIRPAERSVIMGAAYAPARELRVGNTGSERTILNLASGTTDVRGAARFEAGGVLQGSGTLSAGLGATFGSGSVISLDTGDKLLFTSFFTFGGSVTLDGAVLELDLRPGLGIAYGQQFDLFDWEQGVSGTFASLNLPALGGGLAWDTSDLYIGGSVAVVPEPGAWALMAAGLGLLLARRRRA
jgi:hypothetical protein